MTTRFQVSQILAEVLPKLHLRTSMTVRDGDTVKHYRIRQLDEGGFFIARRTTFR